MNASKVIIYLCMYVFGVRRVFTASGYYFQEATVVTKGLAERADASMTAMEELDLLANVIAKVMVIALRR